MGREVDVIVGFSCRSSDSKRDPCNCRTSGTSCNKSDGVTDRLVQWTYLWKWIYMLLVSEYSDAVSSSRDSFRFRLKTHSVSDNSVLVFRMHGF